MTELQVDQARLEDRRALLSDELAELRRRHMSPRELAPADVAGETAESLDRAVERAERRRERIGPVNPLAEQECAEMEERARFLSRAAPRPGGLVGPAAGRHHRLGRAHQHGFRRDLRRPRETLRRRHRDGLPGGQGHPHADRRQGRARGRRGSRRPRAWMKAAAMRMRRAGHRHWRSSSPTSRPAA